MSEERKEILQQINKRKPYGFFLAATVLYFIHKGILYASIGSYIPLLTILCITGLMIFCRNHTKKAYSLFVGIWSSLIIVWSVVRLLLWIVDRFIKPIPEAHVHDQFGLFGNLLSFGFLIAGIYLWKHRKLTIG